MGDFRKHEVALKKGCQQKNLILPRVHFDIYGEKY